MEPDKFTSLRTVASEYVNAYFTHLRTPSGRPNLATLYRPTSTVLWNDMYQTGREAIVAYYESLPYENAEFRMKDMKVCPSGGEGVVVVVTGDMDLGGEEGLLEGVLEVFCLERDGEGWFISGQILGFLRGMDGGGGEGLMGEGGGVDLGGEM